MTTSIQDLMGRASKVSTLNGPLVLLRGTFDTGATLLQTAETVAALITDLRASGQLRT